MITKLFEVGSSIKFFFNGNWHYANNVIFDVVLDSNDDKVCGEHKNIVNIFVMSQIFLNTTKIRVHLQNFIFVRRTLVRISVNNIESPCCVLVLLINFLRCTLVRMSFV